MAYIPEVRADSPFSWTNFPFGVFSTKEDEKTRCGTAIGDVVLDLSLLIASGLYDDQVIIDAWAKVRVQNCGNKVQPLMLHSQT